MRTGRDSVGGLETKGEADRVREKSAGSFGLSPPGTLGGVKGEVIISHNLATHLLNDLLWIYTLARPLAFEPTCILGLRRWTEPI